MPLDDKRNWSGTMYKMYEQISHLDHEVEWIPKLTLSSSEEKKYKTLETGFKRSLNEDIINILIFIRPE